MCYHEISSIFPYSFLERFKKLQSLNVMCSEFTELFSSEFGDSGKATLSRIRNLGLYGVTGLKHIWMQNSRKAHLLPNLESLGIHGCADMISLGLASAPLQSLTSLEVTICRGIIHLVTSSAIQSLVQLKQLSIKQCISMKEIIGNEEAEATYTITFSKLRSLKLEQLPSLASFCSGKHTFNFPSLEQLVVIQCPELKTFSHGVVTVPKLHYIQISDTRRYRHSSINQAIQEVHAAKVGYDEIRYLVLSTPSKSIEAWNDINFKLLECIQVYDCGSLRNIFTVSMVSQLLQLRELSVKRCDLMEQIIKSEGVEESTSDTVLFRNLRFLTLESCGNLTSFYLGGLLVECPCLESVNVTDCAKMLAFASAFMKEQDMETFDGGNEERRRTPPFLSEKVLFPSLTELTVELCNNLTNLFTSSTVQYNFLKLQRIYIENCENLKEVVFREALAEEANMIQIFPSLQLLLLRDLPRLGRFCHASCLQFPMLKELRVKNYPALETFASDLVNETYICPETEGNISLLFNKKVEFPYLEKLKIIGMKNCRRIWSDQLNDDSFCKLNLLWFCDCGKLHNIFPFHMRERLDNLEELKIANCDSLEEIFEASQVENNNTVTTTEFVFPKVKHVGFYLLSKLKRFYSMAHTTQWPSLQKMWLYKCDQMEIFASENLNEGESMVQNSLFSVDKDTFPNLEELIFESNDNMKEIWRGRHGAKFFQKLKVLELFKFPNESAVFPQAFIQSLSNLEKLVVSNASFSELFHSEGISGEENLGLTTFPALNELKLSELFDLRCLWNEEYHDIQVFRELRILQVLECGILDTLVPSSMCFVKLTTLEVSKCHGLLSLIASSTARSLVQLTKMSITECDMIEGIIASKSRDAEEGIFFSQLKHLQLCCLPNLESFCLGDHILDFPSLEKVIVKECTNMKTFCQGDLRAPKLQKLQLTEDEVEDKGLWEGTLNNTIQQLFKVKGSTDGAEHL